MYRESSFDVDELSLFVDVPKAKIAETQMCHATSAKFQFGNACTHVMFCFPYLSHFVWVLFRFKFIGNTKKYCVDSYWRPCGNINLHHRVFMLVYAAVRTFQDSV